MKDLNSRYVDDRYMTDFVNVLSVRASSPDKPLSPAKPSSRPSAETADEKLGRLALAALDWVLPLLLMLVLIRVLRRLYVSRDASTLIVSTAAAGYVFIMIRADIGASQPLLIATGLSYFAFHATYCKTVANNIQHGEGFLGVTVVIAMTVFAILAQFPSLKHLWVESSGLAGMWPVFPLHVASVFFVSLITRVARIYMTHGLEPGPILPVFERGTSDAATARVQSTVAESQEIMLTPATLAVS
ncbi:hypothetical protein E8E11_010591 [Didymella keratinophila]|nr:hypothetical protein E8E11_010591 [Didymella keratinophila]